jgi:CheY-like chemotaxis protein
VLGEDVELHTSAVPDLVRVKIDPSQLEQVLVNLAVNARDAMPRGGALTITISNVVLEEPLRGMHGTAAPGRYALLAVSDTGVGMNEETQRRLFEPFFTTKERGKGTGLGLATCYGIVQQAGGSIQVYSEPGRGSTFKVYLPCTEEREEPAAPHPPGPVRGGHETVLVIEDDARLRALSVRAMRESGYQVLEAADGDEAVRISRAHEGQIDLVVTDVVLPRRNGREVAEEIAAQRPQMQVLFVSGYTEDSAVLKGVLESGIHFLAKPFTTKDLARKVRAVLDER